MADRDQKEKRFDIRKNSRVIMKATAVVETRNRAVTKGQVTVDENSPG